MHEHTSAHIPKAQSGVSRSSSAPLRSSSGVLTMMKCLACLETGPGSKWLTSMLGGEHAGQHLCLYVACFAHCQVKKIEDGFLDLDRMNRFLDEQELDHNCPGPSLDEFRWPYRSSLSIQVLM